MPGSRSRCLDGCSRQRTAFPLHLDSRRRREIVLPHQCKRCLLSSSRATVSCGSTEKPFLWLKPISAPTKMGKRKKKKNKRWRYFKKWGAGTSVHCLLPNYGADIAALEPCGPVLVTGTGLPSMREAKIDRAPVRLCLCNSSSLSLVRLSLRCASPTCLSVKAIRAPVAGLTSHLWNYGNSSLLKTRDKNV